MKRSRLGPGKKSLARGSTFPARRKRPVKGPSEREAAQAWASGNRAKRCARCGAANVQGHHIITRERLKQKAVELDVPAERLLWDRRNRLWLCRRHHDAHHARTSPIPMTVLREHAAKVFQFARELDLKPWLERRYPETDDQRSSDMRTADETTVQDVWSLPTDPRELVRGLMRGDRRLLKVGYTGENATIAACQQLEIEDAPQALELLGYAYGFAYGMADKALPDDDHNAVCESCATTVVREGWNAGQDEDPLRIYPAAGPA